MSQLCKVKIKKLLITIAVLLLFTKTFQISAKYVPANQFFKTLTADTTPLKTTTKRVPVVLKTDTSLRKDTIRKPGDTIKRIQVIDTLTLSRDSLDAPVHYSASDSAVLLIPSKQFILYGQAKTNYNDVALEAAVINYNQQTQLITAFGGRDTSNNPLNKPKFTQGGATSISDTIVYNMKSGKGLTKNTYYQEGEIFVNAQVVKKVTPDIAYAFNNRFTTCNLDTPHFDIKTRKMKLINNKLAVSGPAHFEFEGVPIPIYIPFGIYPLNRGRHSGVLAPQFTTNDQFGLGLEGLGFYKVLNDNFDVTIRSNLYSYGGWSLNVNPRYFKRYHYTGNLSFSLQKTKILNAAYYSAPKEEFTQNKSFFVSWSHSLDSKARPGVSFNANVNAGSTKFNTYVPNNAYRNYQNQLSSSISYNKTWGDGKYNLSFNALHNQNDNLHLVNLSLPNIAFSANTVYPFRKEERIGQEKWYEKLGISYTGNFFNQISFYDTAFNFRRIIDTIQWGVQHNIPISLSLPALGPFIVSPSISFSERWFGQKMELLDWNTADHKVDTVLRKGFYAAREVQMGLSANTRIFGTVNFKKSSNIVAIRHEIKPNIGLSYKPDMVKNYYKEVRADSQGHKVRYSQLNTGSSIGAFSEGRFGGLTFGIDNLFEMKVRDKNDTSGDGTRKVRLIDGLSINSGYNFFGDSLKLLPFNISFRSTLFDKISITGGALINPYLTDSFGRNINKLVWNGDRFSIGRFSSGNLAISTSLQSKKANKEKLQTTVDPTLTPDEQQRQLDYIRENPTDFVDFDIPWNLSLSFSLNFARYVASDLKLKTETNANINVNGDFSLTPKWKIGGGTYFDFRTAKLQALNLFVTRDMHCWQMAININIGNYKSFSITINPKSGLLRDLRINRSRSFYNF
ncbi:MAG: LPS-assembly protein LptD [Chitinophagaceae bacterium]|nr:LPS-assembly protein LptD [Chitinophagaceae bacterium]